VLVLCCIIREVQFTDEHNTLTSVSNLALVLRAQGKYDEAEKPNRRALEGSEKELGKLHPDTLTSVGNPASVLQDQGKYDEAERLNRRALEGREKELGEQHPDTLTSVYCLAYLLQKQRRYEGASELSTRELATAISRSSDLSTQPRLLASTIMQACNTRWNMND
jgi:tetratricopeptide (TPR) repeat protein